MADEYEALWIKAHDASEDAFADEMVRSDNGVIASRIGDEAAAAVLRAAFEAKLAEPLQQLQASGEVEPVAAIVAWLRSGYHDFRDADANEIADAIEVGDWINGLPASAGNPMPDAHPAPEAADQADKVRALVEEVEQAIAWHEGEDKAISKLPRANVGDNGWRRHQHQEEAARLRTALDSFKGEGA